MTPELPSIPEAIPETSVRITAPCPPHPLPLPAPRPEFWHICFPEFLALEADLGKGEEYGYGIAQRSVLPNIGKGQPESSRLCINSPRLKRKRLPRQFQNKLGKHKVLLLLLSYLCFLFFLQTKKLASHITILRKLHIHKEVIKEHWGHPQR